MVEIWKDIPGYEGKYQVSNLGNVIALNYAKSKKAKYLKQWDSRGYKYVVLYNKIKNKYNSYNIHRLVALLFLENPENLPEVNHKDENPSNNHVDNLEWCSHKYNMNYGTNRKRMGIKHWKSVNCYDLYGNFIKSYKSMTETKNDGFNLTGVFNCCRGKQQSHHGYRFEYA